MRKNRYKNYHCNAGCPVELALEKMGGKWKGMIIFHLLEGTKRFSELKQMNTQITQKVLTKQLRELEADGLVHREVFAVVPPKTEYSLTNLGSQLRPIINGLEKWGQKQLSTLKDPT